MSAPTKLRYLQYDTLATVAAPDPATTEMLGRDKISDKINFLLPSSLQSSAVKFNTIQIILILICLCPAVLRQWYQIFSYHPISLFRYYLFHTNTQLGFLTFKTVTNTNLFIQILWFFKPSLLFVAVKWFVVLQRSLSPSRIIASHHPWYLSREIRASNEG